MALIKNIWLWLKRPSANIPLGLLLVIGIIVGMVGWIGFNGALGVTNTMEFCTSCHEMQWPLDEYKKSIHYSNRTGVRATCSDCHVPKGDSIGGWFDKIAAKVMAAKDTYHHIIGTFDTKEKYESGRWKMANAVWARMRERHSKECKNCHDFRAMDPHAQNRVAQRRHQEAEKAGKSCVDCHTGIAHEEPVEPEENSDATETDESSK